MRRIELLGARVPKTSAAVLLILSTLAPAAGAGQGSASGDGSGPADPALALPFDFDGPPVPALPAMVSRDTTGRATIRTVRLTQPLRLDGRLDEAVYGRVSAISDFLQQDPVEGVVATEKTEFWIFFDDDALYVTFRCWESRPEALVVNEMRRDGNTIFQGDHVAFLVDTFYDRRNGVEIAVNAIGGRWDGQIANERQANANFNPIWELATGRFDGGWTVELAIPFKSLRYRPGRAQIWGFNVRRVNRAKNETSFLTRVPRALGQQGLFQASLAATLVGLEAPPASLNLEIKPYAVSSLTSDVAALPRLRNEPSGDVGVDVKYGLTPSLVADLTVNTDFAQVEADEQQVNLTRFSLFFPEKREFFLENQGIFGFGGVGTSGSGDVPILFHSRRIGFDEGRAVPIHAGGRVTGRVGRFTLGLVDIQSGEEPTVGARGTNFSVVRVKRDVLRRSSVGVLYTGRSARLQQPGDNHAMGVDGTFAFFDNLYLNGYWARTSTDGIRRSDASYRAQLDYNGDRYGLQLERLVIDAGFNPDVGYVRRHDIRRSSGAARFSPRPRANRRVRKYSYEGALAYTENTAGRVEMRDWRGEFGIEFQNSDQFNASYGGIYEFLPLQSRILGLDIPVGGYQSESARVGFTFGRQRPLSGTTSIERGDFYGGHKTTVTVSAGRVAVSPRLSFEPTYIGNWASLPQGATTTHLTGTRVTYTMTPTMFTSALLQYNTGVHAVSANVRLRWEYRPGSELFVVLNEQRDTQTARYPDLVNRAIIVKVNRLVRF